MHAHTRTHTGTTGLQLWDWWLDKEYTSAFGHWESAPGLQGLQRDGLVGLEFLGLTPSPVTGVFPFQASSQAGWPDPGRAATARPLWQPLPLKLTGPHWPQSWLQNHSSCLDSISKARPLRPANGIHGDSGGCSVQPGPGLGRQHFARGTLACSQERLVSPSQEDRGPGSPR